MSRSGDRSSGETSSSPTAGGFQAEDCLNVREFLSCQRGSKNSSFQVLSIRYLDPFPASAAFDNGLDHFHIGHGVLERRRNRGVVDDGQRKQVALDRVLIANVESYLFNA